MFGNHPCANVYGGTFATRGARTFSNRPWGNVCDARMTFVWSLIERGLAQWWRMGSACDWKKLGKRKKIGFERKN